MPLLKSANAPDVSRFSMTDIEQEAASILAGAKRRAQVILDHARTDAERERTRAYEEGLQHGRRDGHVDGFAEGLEKGREQAYADYSQKLPQVFLSFEAALRAVNGDREQLAARAADEVALLAVAIAEKICLKAGLFDPQVLAGNLHGALRLVLDAEQIRVHVAPRDAAAAAQVVGDLGLRYPVLTHVQVTEDESVTPGSCRVSTRGGRVDADLKTQIDRLVEELFPGPRADTDLQPGGAT